MRVCYAHFPQAGRIYLLALYTKNEQSDLPPAHKAAYRRILQMLSEQLKEH
jgi:hypothetical protein